MREGGCTDIPNLTTSKDAAVLWGQVNQSRNDNRSPIEVLVNQIANQTTSQKPQPITASQSNHQPTVNIPGFKMGVIWGDMHAASNWDHQSQPSDTKSSTNHNRDPECRLSADRIANQPPANSRPPIDSANHNQSNQQ